MKRLPRLVPLAIILSSLLMALIPFSIVAADQVVVFPDPNLEALIRQTTGKPSGDIYQSDLSTIETIAPGESAIVDLTGLEYCTNLRALCLPRNAVSDLSPLSILCNLASLNLQCNQIDDISPLVNSPGLGLGDSVWLEGNPLSSTSRYTWIPMLQARGVQVGWSMPVEHSAVWTPMVSGTSAALNGIWGSSTISLRAFSVNAAPPTLHSIRPTHGQHGQTLTVTITGDYLTGTETLDFGDGTAVDRFTVDSATQVSCDVTIAADAALGATDISIATPAGTCTLASGFAVVETEPGTPDAKPGTPDWVWICAGVSGGAVVTTALSMFWVARRGRVSK